MKNLILTYEKVDIKNGMYDFFEIDNFTEKKKIPNVILNQIDYYEFIEIPDNQKIEYVAYDLYGDTKYWDIILLLNGLQDPLELPNSHSYVVDRATENTIGYMNYYKITDEEVYQKVYNNYYQEELEKNEKYRMIKVVKPHKIISFEKAIRRAGVVMYG